MAWLCTQYVLPMRCHTQVSVQEDPICECFKDPRINNTEGGTELFYSATFGERKLWVQCFLDLETFEAIHSCHQEWTRGAHQAVVARHGHPLFPSTTSLKIKAVLVWGADSPLIRTWSLPPGGLPRASMPGPKQDRGLLWLKNRWPVSFLTMPRANKRLRSCRCGTLHIAEIKLVARTWSSLAFPRDQSSKCQDSCPFPPEPMLEGPRKTTRTPVPRLVTRQVSVKVLC